MLLLLESTTSCAKVLAWLPDAPPNLVPLGNVIVCGFCSSGCCTTSCCGGGCAHAQNTAVIITIVIRDNSFFLIKPPIQFLKFAASDLGRRICASVSTSFLVSGWPSTIGTNSDPKPDT